MKKYIRMMRLDHWIKQFFILPGCLCAYFLCGVVGNVRISVEKLVFGFFSVCFVASANYVINEYLDAAFDRFHPTKKNRSAIQEHVDKRVVFLLYAFLSLLGFLLGFLVNIPFLLMAVLLWLCGIFYNVPPMRVKDIAILDVLSESLNNAIRFFMGWFMLTVTFLPPCSVVFGYWMVGAFLMAVKRYAEYRMIGNAEVAGNYRRSFRFYTERSLLISAFFYAMCAIFFLGIFLIKYRVELVLLMPPLIGLFCYYFYLSFKEDSATQKPEKLYKEKGLMLYCAALVVLFALLLFLDIPWLSIFTTEELLPLGGSL